MVGELLMKLLAHESNDVSILLIAIDTASVYWLVSLLF